MKKLLFTLLLLGSTCGPQNDLHKIHDSTVEITPAPKLKHPYGYSEWHICFYQNGEIVQEYDTITDLNTEGSYINFKYHDKKYRVRMDYIAESCQ